MRQLLARGIEYLRASAKRQLTDLESLTADVDRLDAALAATPDNDSIKTELQRVARLEAELQAAKVNLEQAEDAVSNSIRQRDAARRNLEVCVDETLALHVNNSRVMRLQREITDADKTLEQFSHIMVSKHLIRITTAINSALEQLLTKQHLVSEVMINSTDLSVVLLDSRMNQINPRSLSAGERQMMATAILWGLSQSTNRVLPTIIDAPLGRLDRSHRMNLVERYFPHASRQVVLLSTDEEIVGEHLARLRSNVGAYYTLDFDDSHACTTVSEGYWDV